MIGSGLNTLREIALTSFTLVKTGRKAAVSPPSPKSRRARFGSVHAMTNASATAPLPSSAACRTSRVSPSARLVAVSPPRPAALLASERAATTGREADRDGRWAVLGAVGAIESRSTGGRAL